MAEPLAADTPAKWPCLCGLIDCSKLLIWRAEGSDRQLWKTVCSLCITGEMAMYMYVVWDMPLLILFGAMVMMKMLIEVWGQETPTWVCPGGILLFLLIYLLIIPGVIYADGLCTRNPDIHFPHRGIVGAIIFFLGFFYSLWYEVNRFRWKRCPENKGKLHTIGLAKYCIHPNYFGDLFTYTGWALCAGTTCALSLPLGMLWSFVFIVNPNSDAYLAQRYWREWPEYASNTATLIPFVRSSLLNQMLGIAGFMGTSWLGANCAGQCG
mmetsp:Transcript_36888/g.70930  ORF Transcript_36888/g.70930 Transcript_36888/m.70930 type:complete len:267 (+) Transcript_36888:3-803(+)